MKWKTAKLKNLAETLTKINQEKDMLAFLRDLCTLEELGELSNRWEAARLLNKGETYRAVAKKTGMSTTTVSRIAHWIKNGEGGYKKSLEQD